MNKIIVEYTLYYMQKKFLMLCNHYIPKLILLYKMFKLLYPKKSKCKSQENYFAKIKVHKQQVLPVVNSNVHLIPVLRVRPDTFSTEPMCPKFIPAARITPNPGLIRLPVHLHLDVSQTSQTQHAPNHDSDFLPLLSTSLSCSFPQLST